MSSCSFCGRNLGPDPTICPGCGVVAGRRKTEPQGRGLDSSRRPLVPFVSGHARALWVKAFLAITILLDVLLIWPAYAETGPDYVEGGHSLDFLWLYAFLSLIATAFFFLMWMHRSHRNLRAIGAVNLKYSPKSAVFWWFVPIMNLFKPKQVVDEIWKWSVGTDTALVNLWWFLWVIGFFSEPIVGSSIWGSLIVIIIDIPAAILAIRLVHKIETAQTSKSKEFLSSDNLQVSQASSIVVAPPSGV